MSHACELCNSNHPTRYRWQNVCCRVRFLVGQPNRAARQGWVGRWKAKGETELVAAVIEALRGMA